VEEACLLPQGRLSAYPKAKPNTKQQMSEELKRAVGNYYKRFAAIWNHDVGLAENEYVFLSFQFKPRKSERFIPEKNT